MERQLFNLFIMGVGIEEEARIQKQALDRAKRGRRGR